jgi:YD repeat-containing protein
MTSELDADGRLQTFTYDAFGRETGDVQFTGSTTFTPIADSIAFGYDANGNMTLASNNYGTYTMQYDPLGRLTFVSEPVGVDLTFGYDGDGNRTLEKDSLGARSRRFTTRPTN